MGCDAFLAEKPTNPFTVGSTTNKWVAVDSFDTLLCIDILQDVTSKIQQAAKFIMVFKLSHAWLCDIMQSPCSLSVQNFVTKK